MEHELAAMRAAYGQLAGLDEGGKRRALRWLTGILLEDLDAVDVERSLADAEAAGLFRDVMSE